MAKPGGLTLASRSIVVIAVTLVLASTFIVSALPVPNPFPDDPIPGPTSTDAAIVGKWSAPFDGEIPAISMALTHTGDVVYWGGIEARERDNVFFGDTPYDADAIRILSPPYGPGDVTTIAMPAEMGDFFCAGLTILGDGRILVAGGSRWQDIMDPDYQGFVSGLAETWIYTPSTRTWERATDMNWVRWYPTLMTDWKGDAVALGGIDHLTQPQTMIGQVETLANGVWTDLPATADNILPMYPRIFTVPGGPMKGDLFFETSATLWGPFGEHPVEPLWNLEQVLDNETKTWSFVGPSLFGARQHAGTVMLPLAKGADGEYTAQILTFGGSLGRSIASTPLTEITTLGEVVEHQMADALTHPRWMANGVLLPDGTVLAVGGGMYDNVYVHGQDNPAVRVAEQYDPATDKWEQRAAQAVDRMYHSSVLLLPDGRVLSGGHVPLPVPWTVFRDNFAFESQVVEKRFEVYEPPYLHWNVERPAIASAPASIEYDAFFDVTITNPALEIKDALLVRPGSTTHVWDTSQRAIVLPLVEQVGDLVRFQAPPDGDVATPGPWMLFLRVDSPNGIVPGVAKFVDLG